MSACNVAKGTNYPQLNEDCSFRRMPKSHTSLKKHIWSRLRAGIPLMARVLGSYKPIPEACNVISSEQSNDRLSVLEGYLQHFTNVRRPNPGQPYGLGPLYWLEVKRLVASL
jgi:hypothetical protein